MRFLPALLASLVALTAAACDLVTSGEGEGESEGEGEGEGEDVDDGDACTDGDRSRGPSEACCLDFGADACGAGLFCAAFDGRTVPSCYVEGSRLDGDECTADLQCASRSCDVDAEVCRALPGQPCDVDIGCAPFDGADYICAVEALIDDKTRCVVAGRDHGDHCADDAGCDSGICGNGTCSDGREGDSCGDDDDCNGSTVCAIDTCSSGEVGDECGDDDDCTDGRCFDSTCSDGAPGDGCDDSADCDSGLVCTGDDTCGAAGVGDDCSDDVDCVGAFAGCFEGVCVARNAGQTCDSDPDCGALRDCVEGVCAVTCDDSFACYLGGLFLGETRECRPAGCVAVGALNDACSVDSDCATDVGGLDCFDDTCLRRDEARCTEDVECGSGACEPVTRNRCTDAEGTATLLCDRNADCDDDERCQQAALTECVEPT